MHPSPCGCTAALCKGFSDPRLQAPVSAPPRRQGLGGGPHCPGLVGGRRAAARAPREAHGLAPGLPPGSWAPAAVCGAARGGAGLDDGAETAPEGLAATGGLGWGRGAAPLTAPGSPEEEAARWTEGRAAEASPGGFGAGAEGRTAERGARVTTGCCKTEAVACGVL